MVAAATAVIIFGNIDVTEGATEAVAAAAVAAEAVAASSMCKKARHFISSVKYLFSQYLSLGHRGGKERD